MSQSSAKTQPRTGMPRLEGASIDLAAYRTNARNELLAMLRSQGKTNFALVLDPSLSGPLSLVAEVREFREQGVDKIYHLLPEPLQTDCTHVVYLIRPQLRLAEQVAAQVRAFEKGRAGRAGAQGEAAKTFTVIFVPRRSMLCEKVLADEGVHGVLTVRELPLSLFVLEDDVLSLEQPPSCFRDCFHDDDRTVLHACASGLARMQALYGKFATIRGKGECAQVVKRTLQHMSLSLDDGEPPVPPPPPLADGADSPRPDAMVDAAAAAVAAALAIEPPVATAGGGADDDAGLAAFRAARASGPPKIAELLLLDRDVDLVTPLCTELTYEGLIHQTFGIAHGYVDLDPEIVAAGEGGSGGGGGGGGGGAQPARALKKELNNNDPLYSQIRNLNFGELGPLLNRLARGVSDGYEERHQAQTVTQIRDYMKKLSKLQQEHKSLSTHVAIAERIQRVTKEERFHKRLECEQEALSSGACSSEAEALVEDLAADGEPLPSVLRLLCLLSLVGNGIRPKTLTHLQSELTHAYGFGRLALTWPALSRAGLLKRQEGRSSWSSLKKSLRLIVDAMPDHELGAEPPDLAYVYAGYAPLSVRLAHAMVAQPPSLDDTMKLLPGPYFSQVQRPVAESDERWAASGDASGAFTSGGSGGAPHDDSPAATGGGGGAAAPRPPVTVVFFLGGCTYAEIAALRWLGRNATPRREYIVATTHIITGDTLIESLCIGCDNGLENAD